MESLVIAYLKDTYNIENVSCENNIDFTIKFSTYYIRFIKYSIKYYKCVIYNNDEKIIDFVYIFIDGENSNFYLLEKELNILFNTNISTQFPTLDLLNIENFKNLEYNEYTEKLISTKEYNNILEKYFDKNIYFLKDLLVKTNTCILGANIANIIEGKELNSNTFNILCSTYKKYTLVRKYFENNLNLLPKNRVVIYNNFKIKIIINLKKLKLFFTFSMIFYDGKKVKYSIDAFNLISDIYNFDINSNNMITLLSSCEESSKCGYVINGYITEICNLW